MEQYLTVSEITKYISKKFQYDPYLEKVYLKGEISNYNPRRKGITQYFNLKDEKAIIPVILFPLNAKKIKFDIEEGMSVLVTGRVSVYQPAGRYQFIIETIEPDGVGSLYLAYEQTKNKLQKEGLFSPEFKKKIPLYPKKIGVLTSQSGSVIQDILTTIKRRYPITEVILFPTLVQGDKSADSIVKNLKRASNLNDLDVIIIARGGGSFEDLYSFNEEKVIRQIFALKIPVISSIGHETDTTLADLVADLRAPTPTAAAELAVPVLSDELLKIRDYNQRIIRSFQSLLTHLFNRYERSMNSVIFKQPDRLYDGYIQNIDYLEQKLIYNIENIVNSKKQPFDLLNQRLSHYPIQNKIKDFKKIIEDNRIYLQQSYNYYLINKNYDVNRLIQALEHLSPLKILSRGYSLTEQDGILITSVKEIKENKPLQIQLYDGVIETKIKNISEKGD